MVTYGALFAGYGGLEMGCQAVIPGSPLRVEFLRGRMRFDRPDWQPGPKGDRPPFGCCLLIWQREDASGHCDDCGDVLTADTTAVTCTSHALCIACDFGTACRECAREKREALR